MDRDVKFLKKNVKSLDIDVHPTEKALLIKYELEATLLGEFGDPMLGERKECQKLIRLKDLSTRTDIRVLAEEVCAQCKLIPRERIGQVQQLLHYLQKRKDPGGTGTSSSSPATSESFAIEKSTETMASLNDVEEYIELLYEDTPEKVKATECVLQLARNPDNLEELIKNDTLLGALSRVLREDWKSNFQLATNITYIFFCFSTFTQFHPMIAHFKIGALCMNIIEYEMKRYQTWLLEFQNDDKKLHILTTKQSELMRICTYLLLNLSEDVAIEVKMVNKGIVKSLCQLLTNQEHQKEDLILLILAFLRKLSIFKENKSQMASNNIIEKLLIVFNSDFSEEVLELAIKLLFNLSFDTTLRKKMVKLGILDRVCPLLGSPKLAEEAVRLLYQLSHEDDARSLFTYTDCIPHSLRMLLQGNVNTTTELIALLINLASEKRNAILLIGENGKGLKILTEFAISQRNPFLMKIISNIATHPDQQIKNYFKDHISRLFENFQKCCIEEGDRNSSSYDFGLECLGAICQLAYVSDIEWSALIEDLEVMPWVQSQILSERIPDTELQLLISFVGLVAFFQETSILILRNSFAAQLLNLMSAKQEDDEIVLQILRAFNLMLQHSSSRDKLLSSTELVAFLIDLMHDKNKQIRRLCDSALQFITETSSEWAVKIQEQRFRWHNGQWLEMVAQQAASPIAQSHSESLFSDLVDLQAEDILNNYDSDRPISRLDFI